MASEFVIFYDPANNNEIRFLNSRGSLVADDTTEHYNELTTAGCIKVVLTDTTLQGKASSLVHNAKVVLTDSVVTDIVTHTNSVQPVVEPEENVDDQITALEARIAALEAG